MPATIFRRVHIQVVAGIADPDAFSVYGAISGSKSKNSIALKARLSFNKIALSVRRGLFADAQR